MIRSELVHEMQQQYSDLPAEDVERIVSLFFQDISDHLSKSGRVELRGFGVFSTRSREARMGRNPRTGQDVPVAAKKALHFKPGRQMLARLQAKPAD